jgi:rhodanese-related sulfurtransferase
MRQRFILFGFMLLIFSGGCAQDKNYDRMLKGLYTGDVPVIHPKQLSDTIEKGAKVILLDSREQNEFNVSHIQNALYVGYDDFILDSLKSLSKDDFIVIYCSVGYRSEKIGEKLIAAGYKHVFNLYGGIFEWVNEGYVVVDNNNQPTPRVHAYSKSWGRWLKKGEKVYD